MNAQGKAADKDERKALIVTVDNEDDGRTIEIKVEKQDRVQVAIDQLYRELGRERHEKDRLRCAGSKDSVFRFAREKFKDYVDHCPKLHWLFAGPTGGAQR